MNLTRTIDSASEPVSLSEARSQLRILNTDNDESLRLFIASIRQQTETFLAKTLITSTWELKLDKFEEEMLLPMSPIQSISSIIYDDDDGISQTLSATLYQFDKKGRLKPAYDEDWPDTRDQYDAVTITYVTGESDAGQVKDDIKLAMLIWIATCDGNREDVVTGTIVSSMPITAKNLLSPYKNWQMS